MKSVIVNILLLCLAVSEAVSIPKREAKGTATVNLAVSNGPANALGSGFIYGFPDNGTSASTAIPDHFLTDIRFQAGRAGGAQIPYGGWKDTGKSGYSARFDSTLSNYRTTRRYDGQFLMLPHDMWGAQGGMTEADLHPGDNGNWTEMEVFLNQLISDMKENNIIDGVVIDLWNEPDLGGCWSRSWDQYLEYIGRSHKIFKAQLPQLPTSGPSSAHSPHIDNEKWHAWCSYYYGYMKGERAGTTASSDLRFDVFAVKGDFVKIIAGGRMSSDAYDIHITGLTSVGFPESGDIGVRTLRFDWAGKTGEVGGPVDLGVQVYKYSNNEFTVNVVPTTGETAFAFEF
ncbi:hypothetical protein G7Z17_g290 [Cylindrodendrum hubeiense]|uniref:Glycoside hydrolase family 39 protein n=1 Tax=Cylindrodendrum hubeiense TaxID=595255 RepID=A0A9P5HSG0_9HYPO|nr:hypothetical protein G7Z17_g290 [Cylindrodendrum hubeiense]